ncbi:MAG TPA: FkbM family methyltransferase [Nitrososphaerales archaeon]|nr:FkbM family methyltransferase [Nitrososphaerales archaeon]HUK75899.1 FkbM family methyltransferase [Nitrososphaerales archaeon]
MFSWRYARHALTSALANPGAVFSSLRGGSPGAAINHSRMSRWAKTRQEYAGKPRRTLGFGIYLNPDDMSQISAMIATSGWLDPPVTCLMMARLRPGMAVIDVGANLGYYSLLAAKLVGASGRVLSFEPEPRNFQYLERSIRASGLGNVEALRMAVADERGTKELFLAPDSEPNAHTLSADRGMGSVEAQTTTLDEFWGSRGSGRLDLLKVHVFGDEPVVLSGGRRVLEDERPMVLTRFGSPRWSDFTGLLEWLYSLYRVYEFVESPRLIKPVSMSALAPGTRKGIFLEPREGR